MDKPIGIGMLTARFYPCQGGAEIQCRLLSSRLITSGQKATILTQKLPKTHAFELIDNIPVYRMGLPISNRLGSFFYFLASIKMIIKKFNDFDILHAHIASTPAIIASLFTMSFNKPSIVKFAGSRNTGDIAVSLRTIHGRMKLNFIRDNASAFVCPSSEVATELEKFGFQKEKIYTIPNGVDTDTYTPANSSEKNNLKKRIGFPLGSKTVVYSGRLEKGKGLETLIDAWRYIEEVGVTPAPHLALFGEGSSDESFERSGLGLEKCAVLWVE